MKTFVFSNIFKHGHLIFILTILTDGGNIAKRIKLEKKKQENIMNRNAHFYF